MRTPVCAKKAPTGSSAAVMVAGSMARVAPAMPIASSGPTASSCALVGTSRNNIARRPPWANVASVSVAPVKSSPYQP